MNRMLKRILLLTMLLAGVLAVGVAAQHRPGKTGRPNAATARHCGSGGDTWDHRGGTACRTRIAGGRPGADAEARGRPADGP